ncbi:unnamed protein product [Rhizopus stolonifer]
MEATIPKKERKKTGRKKKSKRKESSDEDPQISMAKHQAEVLKESSARLSSPPELAIDGGRNNSRALRLRLDLNLDAEIKLKAKIKENK